MSRPDWCPEKECNYMCSSQNVLCFGGLPKPEKHLGVDNTHRMCMRGASDDGGWRHSLLINKGDAWNLHRLLGQVFGFMGN